MKDASFGEIFGKLSLLLLQPHPFAVGHAPLHNCTLPSFFSPLFQEKFSFAKIKEGELSHRVDIRRKRWRLTKERPLLRKLTRVLPQNISYYLQRKCAFYSKRKRLDVPYLLYFFEFLALVGKFRSLEQFAFCLSDLYALLLPESRRVPSLPLVV